MGCNLVVSKDQVLPKEKRFIVYEHRFCKTDLNDMIYLLTAVGLSPGGSSTVHICTYSERHKTNNI